MARTLYDKLWDSHVVTEREDGTALIYIDRQLIHEVTSPQAFEGLRIAGRKPWRRDANLATPDHNVPTTADERKAGIEGIEDPVDMIEREIAPDIYELSERVKNTPLKFIAKLADIVDAKIFILEEGIGSEAKTVSQRVSKMFDEKINEAKKAFPELNWDAAKIILEELMETS